MTLSKNEVIALLGGRKPESRTEQTVRPWTEMPNPVKSYARIASHADRKKTIRIHLEIARGWYIYGKPLTFPYMNPLSVDIRGSAIQEVLEIAFPAPRHHKQAQGQAPVTVYDGNIVIEAKLLMKKTLEREAEDIRVLLRYQACSSAGTCLAPVNTAYRVAA